VSLKRTENNYEVSLNRNRK